MIEINNLNVSFDNLSSKVLDNINLAFKNKGTINLIAGENGSGKSMLANAITGILHKFKDVDISGSILLDDIDYGDLDTNLSETIGFLPQYPADYVLNQVVRDEISFSLENLGMGKEEIESTVFELLTQLGIENLSTRVMSELSSGELQKVALATALAPQPSILVLDEPFSRIDSTSALHLLKTLVELKEKKIILLIFEHHLDYLLDIADRLIILADGKIIADGDPLGTSQILGQNLLPELMKVELDCNRQNSKTFSLNLLFRQITEKMDYER